MAFSWLEFRNFLRHPPQFATMFAFLGAKMASSAWQRGESPQIWQNGGGKWVKWRGEMAGWNG